MPSLLNPQFLLLLAGLIVVRPLVPVRWYPLFGAVASAVVIGWTSPVTLAVIGGVALLLLYPVNLIVGALQQGGHSGTARAVRITAIVLLVAFMIGFKVQRHFRVPFIDDDMLGARLLHLVGFSYFLFRAINFLFMQSLAGYVERSPWTVLYYSLFPPTLTSGPIQKFLDFRGQMSSPVRLDRRTLGEGIYRITRGYFRKIAVAYLLDELIRTLLAGEQHAWVSLVIIVALYLYFFFDFAGYSDIAIGFGLLLGVRVPENFKRPFVAASLTEFWRNWHITLVDWLRDHVFIPLGGMHAARLKSALLGCLIMVLCGLWHGLTWPFLLWGFWHGAHLFLEGVTGSKPIPPSRRHGRRYWGRVVWTNARVAFGAILFLPSYDSIRFVLEGLIQW